MRFGRAQAEVESALNMRRIGDVLGSRRIPDRRRGRGLAVAMHVNITLKLRATRPVRQAGNALRLAKYLFGARDLRFGGVRSKFQIADSPLLNHRLKIVEGVLGAESTALLQEFFAARRS